MLSRAIAGVALVMGLLLFGALPAHAGWSYSCRGVFDVTCNWVLTNKGAQPVVPPSQQVWRPAGVVEPDPCLYRQIMSQPAPGDAAWGGHDPEHGRLWQAFCPDALAVAERDENGNNIIRYGTPSDPYYVPDGTAPNQANTIDPMMLVARAEGNLTIPVPVPNFGPDTTRVAVKIPVWLWTDAVPPIVQTAAAGTLTATVTAELTATTWDMGEPADPATPTATVPAVQCAGPGMPYTAGANPAAPPCGYTYLWRSLPERTAGAGTWPVTVTAHWTITWTLSTGATGTDTVDTRTTVPLRVREWHSILQNTAGG